MFKECDYHKVKIKYKERYLKDEKSTKSATTKVVSMVPLCDGSYAHVAQCRLKGRDLI